MQPLYKGTLGTMATKRPRPAGGAGAGTQTLVAAHIQCGHAPMDTLQGLGSKRLNARAQGYQTSNICRSPIAEGTFQKTVNDMSLGGQWEIDSAAIGGWHVGNPPDWRALDTMKNHGVAYNNCARQITSEDFNYYDYIFGMDEANMKDLKRRAPKNSRAKVLLFGDFDPQGDRIIRDPYYDSDAKGFEKCYQQSVRCSKGFLENLQKE